MPPINLDAVNILNEADLTDVLSPTLTDIVHLTQGRRATLNALKNTILAGESTAISDVNIPTPTATTATVQVITGSTTNSSTLPAATPTTAGLMTAADKAKVNTIPTGGVDGSETRLQNGTNVNITGVGTAVDPYVINASGGGGASFTQQTLASKVKVLAVPGSTTYSVNAGTGVGTLTIANFGDISHASIPVTDGVDYPTSGDFTLEIIFSDNSVNTWDPVANDVTSINNQDIYVPKIEYYGVILPFVTGGKTLTTPSIIPGITWDAGKLILSYTDASSFGGSDRLIFNIDFPSK